MLCLYTTFKSFLYGHSITDSKKRPPPPHQSNSPRPFVNSPTQPPPPLGPTWYSSNRNHHAHYPDNSELTKCCLLLVLGFLKNFSGFLLTPTLNTNMAGEFTRSKPELQTLSDYTSLPKQWTCWFAVVVLPTPIDLTRQGTGPFLTQSTIFEPKLRQVFSDHEHTPTPLLREPSHLPSSVSQKTRLVTKYALF